MFVRSKWLQGRDADPNGQIETILDDAADGVGETDFKADGGPGPLKLRNDRQNDTPAKRIRYDDPQHTFGNAVDGFKAGIVNCRLDGFALRKQPLARPGQADGTGRAVQETDTVPVFQPRHGLSRGRA